MIQSSSKTLGAEPALGHLFYSNSSKLTCWLCLWIGAQRPCIPFQRGILVKTHRKCLIDLLSHLPSSKHPSSIQWSMCLIWMLPQRSQGQRGAKIKIPLAITSIFFQCWDWTQGLEYLLYHWTTYQGLGYFAIGSGCVLQTYQSFLVSPHWL